MLEFILDHLLIIVIACIIIFIVLPFIMDLISTIVTIVIVVAVLGALGIFGPKFLDNIDKPIAATKEFAETTIQPVITKELEKAKFNYEPDTKKYIIRSTSFKLEGFTDKNKADVVYKEKKYTIDVTFLQSFIEKQIEQQNQIN